MSAHKPNIKQIIKDQPKFIPSKNGHQQVDAESMFSPSGPMAAIAQEVIKKLTGKQKLGIAALLYIILSGAFSNLYLIYKLITLAL